MLSRRRSLGVLGVLISMVGVACGGGGGGGTAPKPAAPPPCFTIAAGGNSELRAKDAAKVLDELVQHIHLSPEDEALRTPKSIGDIRMIMRRDAVYLFANAAAFARSLNTLDGRLSEASLELLLGESQLLASQTLNTQEAWVGADLRIARANIASDIVVGVGEPSTDRTRMLAQLIRAVEEGNKVADALGIVAPSHIARGAEVIRGLRVEAPTDARTHVLVAEYHRLRGEWTEFDAAMTAAGAETRATPALRYLKGMEQLERYGRPDLGANIMRESLAAFPKFVRAQAALVLMTTNPADCLREIAKLKQMNEDHYLVMLLEPTLAADHELLRMRKQQGAPNAGR